MDQSRAAKIGRKKTLPADADIISTLESDSGWLQIWACNAQASLAELIPVAGVSGNSRLASI
jgi:hypothetical protein